MIDRKATGTTEKLLASLSGYCEIAPKGRPTPRARAAARRMPPSGNPFLKPDKKGMEIAGLREMRLSAMLKKLYELGIGLHGHILIARAVDMTLSCASRRALVFAPHPDDETLGCGATIMRKCDAGTEVFIVIAADGGSSHRSAVITPAQLSDIRRAEAIGACGSLGVPEDRLVFLGYPDQRLADNLPALRLEAGKLISRIGPQEIYAPASIDSHPDHRALNQAVRSAAADVDYRGAIFEYPIWMQTPGAWCDPGASLPIRAWQALVRPFLALFRLSPAVVRSKSLAGRKRAAMEHYRSQVSNITGEETWSVFPDKFLRKFLERDEIFFRTTDRGGLRAAGAPFGHPHA